MSDTPKINNNNICKNLNQNQVLAPINADTDIETIIKRKRLVKQKTKELIDKWSVLLSGRNDGSAIRLHLCLIQTTTYKKLLKVIPINYH